MAMHVVVVGGGVTGLTAIRHLRARGIAVTLVECTFPFGGRLRPDEVEIPNFGRAVFDPFPLFLGPTRYDADHADAPLGLPPLGLCVAENTPGLTERVRHVPEVHISRGTIEPIPFERVMVTGGAKTLTDLLLPRGHDEHLTVLARTEVTALDVAGLGWRVRVRECGLPSAQDGATRTIAADAVLLTQPVPEAIELLAESGIDCPDPMFEELKRIRYARAMTLAAAFRGTSQMPISGLVSFSDSPITLLYDNHTARGSSTGTAFTAVVSPAWLAEHWDETDEEITHQLLPFIASWAGGELVWHRLRRHERSRASNRPRMPFSEVLSAPPLVIAGDGFAGYVPNQLDAAYTSATHAVSHLCRVLGRIARCTDRSGIRTPARAALEVAVSSVEEAALAVENGADRLFLLAAPEVGGLTPSLDTFLGVRRVVKSARKVSGKRVPVTVLLRPRLGGCDYTRNELDQMFRDAERFLKVGANGIALAALRKRGTEIRVDDEGCRPFVSLARDHEREVAFHRAFDVLPDRRTGLQDLMSLGFTRVITAGRWGRAYDSLDDHAADVAYAGWDLDVAVAGGINANTVGCVVRHTGCRHVFAGFREKTGNDNLARPRSLGPLPRVLQPAQVAATVAILQHVATEDYATSLACDEVTDDEVPFDRSSVDKSSREPTGLLRSSRARN